MNASTQPTTPAYQVTALDNFNFYESSGVPTKCRDAEHALSVAKGIDQDWRGIVFKPDKGDVYVLMFVLIAKPAHSPVTTRQFDRQRLEYVALTRAKRNATVIRMV